MEGLLTGIADAMFKTETMSKKFDVSKIMASGNFLTNSVWFLDTSKCQNIEMIGHLTARTKNTVCPDLSAYFARYEKRFKDGHFKTELYPADVFMGVAMVNRCGQDVIGGLVDSCKRIHTVDISALCGVAAALTKDWDSFDKPFDERINIWADYESPMRVSGKIQPYFISLDDVLVAMIMPMIHGDMHVGGWYLQGVVTEAAQLFESDRHGWLDLLVVDGDDEGDGASK